MAFTKFTASVILNIFIFSFIAANLAASSPPSAEELLTPSRDIAGPRAIHGFQFEDETKELIKTLKSRHGKVRQATIDQCIHRLKQRLWQLKILNFSDLFNQDDKCFDLSAQDYHYTAHPSHGPAKGKGVVEDLGARLTHAQYLTKLLAMLPAPQLPASVPSVAPPVSLDSRLEQIQNYTQLLQDHVTKVTNDYFQYLDTIFALNETIENTEGEVEAIFKLRGETIDQARESYNILFKFLKTYSSAYAYFNEHFPLVLKDCTYPIIEGEIQSIILNVTGLTPDSIEGAAPDVIAPSPSPIHDEESRDFVSQTSFIINAIARDLIAKSGQVALQEQLDEIQAELLPLRVLRLLNKKKNVKSKNDLSDRKQSKFNMLERKEKRTKKALKIAEDSLKMLKRYATAVEYFKDTVPQYIKEKNALCELEGKKKLYQYEDRLLSEDDLSPILLSILSIEPMTWDNLSCDEQDELIECYNTGKTSVPDHLKNLTEWERGDDFFKRVNHKDLKLLGQLVSSTCVDDLDMVCCDLTLKDAIILLQALQQSKVKSISFWNNGDVLNYSSLSELRYFVLLAAKMRLESIWFTHCYNITIDQMINFLQLSSTTDLHHCLKVLDFSSLNFKDKEAAILGANMELLPQSLEKLMIDDTFIGYAGYLEIIKGAAKTNIIELSLSDYDLRTTFEKYPEDSDEEKTIDFNKRLTAEHLETLAREAAKTSLEKIQIDLGEFSGSIINSKNKYGVKIKWSR